MSLTPQLLSPLFPLLSRNLFSHPLNHKSEEQRPQAAVKGEVTLRGTQTSTGDGKKGLA